MFKERLERYIILEGHYCCFLKCTWKRPFISNLQLLEQYSLDIDEDTNQLGPPKYFQYNTSQQWPLQLEGEADMGYSSHSACSSCQQGSQVCIVA